MLQKSKLTGSHFLTTRSCNIYKSGVEFVVNRSLHFTTLSSSFVRCFHPIFLGPVDSRSANFRELTIGARSRLNVNQLQRQPLLAGYLCCVMWKSEKRLPQVMARSQLTPTFSFLPSCNRVPLFRGRKREANLQRKDDDYSISITYTKRNKKPCPSFSRLSEANNKALYYCIVGVEAV